MINDQPIRRGSQERRRGRVNGRGKSRSPAQLVRMHGGGRSSSSNSGVVLLTDQRPEGCGVRLAIVSNDVIDPGGIAARVFAAALLELRRTFLERFVGVAALLEFTHMVRRRCKSALSCGSRLLERLPERTIELKLAAGLLTLDGADFLAGKVAVGAGNILDDSELVERVCVSVAPDHSPVFESALLAHQTGPRLRRRRRRLATIGTGVVAELVAVGAVARHRHERVARAAGEFHRAQVSPRELFALLLLLVLL